MHTFTCDWYTVGITIYASIMVILLGLQLLIFKFGSNTEAEVIAVCVLGWLIALLDFVWGIINCFVADNLSVGVFVIVMGVWVLGLSIRLYYKIFHDIDD